MKKEKSTPLKTVLTIVIGFGVVFVITHTLLFLYSALIIGSAGLISSYLAKWIDFIWMKLAYVLSLIVPTILLTLIFYLFLFPLSLLSKIFKKNDPLILSNQTKSTFINVNKTFTPQSFEKPW